MPCAAPSRNGLGVQGPCGKKALTSVGGASVASANLCQFHWVLANGQYALVAPIVIEP